MDKKILLKKENQMEQQTNKIVDKLEVYEFKNLPKNSSEKIKKLAETYNIELDIMDIDSIWDNTLTEAENMHLIEKTIQTLSGSQDAETKATADFKTRKKSIKNEQEEIERVNLENIKKEIKNTENEFKKSLEKLQSNNSVLEKLYWLPKEYIKAVVNDETELYGLIETGKVGCSKSYSTIQTLKEIKADFVYFSGYNTPLGLFKFLFQNKDKGKIIIFDDTRGILNNPTSISIMINALYSNGGLPRKISWNSSKLKDLPSEFNFEARVILITNELPKGMEIINSRCLHYNFDFNNFEIIAIMKAIAELKHPKLKKEERLEVIKFIENNTDETTENLDLRTQNKIEQLYIYSKDNWKDLAMPMLNTKNKNLTILKRIINECSTLSEAKKKFYEETGMGERTFQRYNLKLKEVKETTCRQAF